MTNPLRAAMSAGYAARTEEFPTCLPENGIPGGPVKAEKRKGTVALGGCIRRGKRFGPRSEPDVEANEAFAGRPVGAFPHEADGFPVGCGTQAADHFDVDGASCGVDPETESYFAVR